MSLPSVPVVLVSGHLQKQESDVVPGEQGYERFSCSWKYCHSEVSKGTAFFICSSLLGFPLSTGLFLGNKA